MTTKGDALGYDLAIGPTAGGVDMSPDGRTCSGVELVCNAVLARSLCDTLSMVGAPGDAVSYGRDVRGWVGSVATEATASMRAQELAVIYARDPRVDPGSISVQIAQARAGSAYDFTINVSLRAITGAQVQLVLGVSAVSVNLLAAQGAT